MNKKPDVDLHSNVVRENHTNASRFFRHS